MATGLKLPGYMTGQCLIAMPGMEDPRFLHAVIYVCAHTDEGAMGLVLNRSIEEISFPDLLGQLGIEPTPLCDQIRIHFGGPVEEGRGFVLHSSDYFEEATLEVDEGISLTANVDVLRAMARGVGPRNTLMALGYAGWAAGQLDHELRENVWLTVPADEELIFSEELSTKWNKALRRLGIDPGMLSETAGSA